MRTTPLMLSIALHGAAVLAALGLAMYARYQTTSPPAYVELRQQVAAVAQQSPARPLPEVESEDVRPEPTVQELLVDPVEQVLEEQPAVDAPSELPTPSSVMQQATLARVVRRKAEPPVQPPVEPVEQVAPEPVAESQAPSQPAVNVEARRTDNAAPDYPEQERRKGREGTVVLRVAVAADGSVEDVTLLTPSRYPGFNRAALRAARKWRFAAATRDGRPIASTTDIEVVFELGSSVPAN